MAIFCHSCSFDETEVRRKLSAALETAAGFSHLRQVAIAARQAVSEDSENVLHHLGYDEDWLSRGDDVWRVEEWLVTAMAPSLKVLPPLEPAHIGTLLIVLSAGGWDRGDIKVLLEGEKSLSLLLPDSFDSALIAGIPPTSKRWLDLKDVQRLATRLEEARDLFFNPDSVVIERLSDETPDGWQRGWNIDPTTHLEKAWGQISARFETALIEEKALLQWSDAPLVTEG